MTPSTQKVIADGIESALLDVHTAAPGSITELGPAGQTASVEIGNENPIPRLDGTFTTERLPILQNVPIVQPRGHGGFFMSIPMGVGVTGLVIFCELSIDQWRSLGVVVNPGDAGRHTLTGAAFVPGLVPNLKILTQLGLDVEAAIGKETGMQIRVGDEVVVIDVSDLITPVDFAANGRKNDAIWDALEIALAAFVPVSGDGGAALATLFTTVITAMKTAQNIPTSLTKLKAQ